MKHGQVSLPDKIPAVLLKLFADLNKNHPRLHLCNVDAAATDALHSNAALQSEFHRCIHKILDIFKFDYDTLLIYITCNQYLIYYDTLLIYITCNQYLINIWNQ